MLSLWSTNMKKSAKISFDYLEQFTNYATLEASAIKELQAEKNIHSEKYYKDEQYLLRKKEKLFKSHISKWGLPIDIKPTKCKEL